MKFDYEDDENWYGPNLTPEQKELEAQRKRYFEYFYSEEKNEEKSFENNWDIFPNSSGGYSPFKHV